MSEVLSFFAAVVTVLAVTVTALAFMAWRRARTPKTALLAGAFLLLTVKAAFVTWVLFTRESFESAVAPVLALDAAALLALYVAIVKR